MDVLMSPQSGGSFGRLKESKFEARKLLLPSFLENKLPKDKIQKFETLLACTYSKQV
jgi:hypothetical protein